MSVLREHILSNDGEIYESLAQIDHNATSNISRLFLIVSYCHPISDLPSVDHLEPPPEIVTDMWAERCLQSKRFVEPDEHVFSRPIPVFPMPGFEKFIVNSTGVANIDLLHVSKAIRLLGAKYDQVLKPGISVLLCNPNKAGEDKLRHAREWRIPAVSIEWLWACVRIGQVQSFRPFQLKQGQVPREIDFDPNPNILARQPEPIEIIGRGRPPKNIQHAETGPGKNTRHRDSFLDNTSSHQTSRMSRVKPDPGEAFLKSPQRTEDSAELRSKKKLPPQNVGAGEDRRDAVEGCEYNDEEAEVGLPLQELSTNSPPKPEMAPSPRKGRLFRHFDGQSSLPGRVQDDDSPSAPEATSTGKTTYIPPQPESINGAIKELLGKNKVKDSRAAHPTAKSKKKRLLGRALSNMSNSSREGCNIQASRASSIDSVNTDGLGSVILDETSQGRRNGTSAGRRSSFTGLACVQEQGVKESPFEFGDAALYREEYHEEEEPPQMTQLGYENPDDAVALREMLAERRRNRTRQGQEDVKPPDAKEGKKIKDDATVASVGRAAGRRTRQMAKNP
jgi:DNA replication regulator DPB11